MDFEVMLSRPARERYDELRDAAEAARANRLAKGAKKSSKPEGLFRQVSKALATLSSNPRHPGLNTHAYDEIPHPYKAGEKVWEAYAQNDTPRAYRIFWCYGPNKGQLTVIAITPHP